MIQANAFLFLIRHVASLSLLTQAHLFAGAKVFDAKVHDQDRRVYDQYQDGGVGAGHAVSALLGKLVDAAGDQQVARRHQQDDGADGGDGAHKGGHQTREEGILDQRQGDGHEHAPAARAQIVG